MKKVKTEVPTTESGEDKAKGGCLALTLGLLSLGVAIYSIYILLS